MTEASRRTRNLRWLAGRYWRHLVHRLRGRSHKRRYVLDYTPELGCRSGKAERLVEYCLGDFATRAILPCTENVSYLNRRSKLLLLRAGPGTVLVSAGLARRSRDQKKIVPALISQRAAIPSSLRCWLVRGDDAGANTDPEQGLHITGMRRAVHRHLVLAPSSCRDRYLGPNLARQMEALRESWVPWENKSDTAWWGGALTGDVWSWNEPQTLTRREVLCHFRDHPSSRVHLNLTRVPVNFDIPSGVELTDRFTKKSAFEHKCLVLLPGNDIASGSSWYFAGNSVVLMPKPHLEHILYFEMEPWEHYVPLDNDPVDILVKLRWVLDHEDKARQIVKNSHDRLRWLCSPEYFWACNEVLRRIAAPAAASIR